MDQEIRTITVVKAAEAESLLRDAFAPYVRRLGREQTAEAYRWLPQACAEGRVYGAYQTDDLQGVVIVTWDENGWTLDQIAVAPALQGSGTGSRLIRHVESEARAAGVPALSLDTAAMMTDLLRLYERHGFRETRRALPGHGKDEHLRVHLTKTL